MSLLNTLDAIEEGTAERRLIVSTVSRLILSNSVASHRGSNKISSTRARVEEKFRFKVLTSILIACFPVYILIEEPKASMASSSSTGVLLAVPSIIRSDIKLATPIWFGSSISIPPSIEIPKLIRGNSSCFAPYIDTPLSYVFFQIFGRFNPGWGPFIGSIERSNEEEI